MVSLSLGVWSRFGIRSLSLILIFLIFYNESFANLSRLSAISRYTYKVFWPGAYLARLFLIVIVVFVFARIVDAAVPNPFSCLASFLIERLIILVIIQLSFTRDQVA
jgi:hypothetical protein